MRGNGPQYLYARCLVQNDASLHPLLRLYPSPLSVSIGLVWCSSKWGEALVEMMLNTFRVIR